MSPCDPIYGADRNANGFICSRGSRPGAKTRCQFCNALGAALLCDGPRADAKTCDAKMCGRCAVGIRALDVDFCPRCVATVPTGCSCWHSPGIPCRGPLVKEDHLCLAHSLLFTRWLQRHGGLDVYVDAALSRDEKRGRFRSFLGALSADATRAVLVEAGWRNA